jgi:RNA polymerase sigma-70 factor (ECF subfamily)
MRSREHTQVMRASQGDEHAFRAIVEQHHRGMHALATRMVGDSAEAEDLVQDSFAKAFSRLQQFDWSYGLSTWLYRIVLNSCRDHLKSPRRSEQPVGTLELDTIRCSRTSAPSRCVAPFPSCAPTTARS